MPAVRKFCEVCHKRFMASRKDTKYCKPHGKCRNSIRQENAKFEVPVIPRSGIPGITFNRVIKRWEVRIKEGPKQWKYIGAFKDLKEATEFQKKVLSS